MFSKINTLEVKNTKIRLHVNGRERTNTKNIYVSKSKKDKYIKFYTCKCVAIGGRKY